MAENKRKTVVHLLAGGFADGAACTGGVVARWSTNTADVTCSRCLKLLAAADAKIGGAR